MAQFDVYRNANPVNPQFDAGGGKVVMLTPELAGVAQAPR